VGSRGSVRQLRTLTAVHTLRSGDMVPPVAGEWLEFQVLEAAPSLGSSGTAARKRFARAAGPRARSSSK